MLANTVPSLFFRTARLQLAGYSLIQNWFKISRLFVLSSKVLHAYFVTCYKKKYPFSPVKIAKDYICWKRFKHEIFTSLAKKINCFTSCTVPLSCFCWSNSPQYFGILKPTWTRFKKWKIKNCQSLWERLVLYGNSRPPRTALVIQTHIKWNEKCFAEPQEYFCFSGQNKQDKASVNDSAFAKYNYVLLKSRRLICWPTGSKAAPYQPWSFFVF